MSNFMKRVLLELESTFESRCNDTRAECGLDMATGEEFCHAEICAVRCPMKPFKSITTIKEAHERFKNFIPAEVAK